MKVPEYIISIAKQNGYSTATFYGEADGVRYYRLQPLDSEEMPSPTGFPCYVVDKEGELPDVITQFHLYDLVGPDLYEAWRKRRVD